MRRILGLDVGSVRVGVALSDPLGLTAQPLEVIERRRVEAEAVADGEIIEEFRPGYRVHDRVVRPAEVCVCIGQEGLDED